MRHLIWIIAGSMVLSGCASGRSRRPQPEARPSAAPERASDPETLPLEPSAYLKRQAAETHRARLERKAEPCRTPKTGQEDFFDEFHETLFRTLCGTARWFDGLFGDSEHPDAARKTSGRLELSTTYSQRDGADFRTRFNVRFWLPNMENRIEAFLGRDDDQDFVQGRSESLALRSQFLDVERDDRWVAGLGYGLPGNYRQKTDFRVGVRGGLRTPETFAQGRFRRNWFIGDNDLWHFHEIVFWTNRDGFGATTAVDYDHVIDEKKVFRWGNVFTDSQATSAWDWRSALVLYHNLGPRKAIAYETFVRGATGAEVQLEEYGVRAVYRPGLASRPWLFGEFVLGYSWPRFQQEEKRRGSAAVGVGIEIRIGEY